MRKKDKRPVCGQDNQYCFAFKEGRCDCLNNTDFGGETCPFYKPNRFAVIQKEVCEREKNGESWISTIDPIQFLCVRILEGLEADMLKRMKAERTDDASRIFDEEMDDGVLELITTAITGKSLAERLLDGTTPDFLKTEIVRQVRKRYRTWKIEEEDGTHEDGWMNTLYTK